MSKRTSPPPKSNQADKPPEAKAHSHFSGAAIRETIESVVIAFVLAFLFRTFEAEAFVIPTGSMAPTLMGRHKDVVCPRCGWAYQAGASEEVNPNTEEPNGNKITACTCPMCRYTASLSTRDLSFNGDRILVDKLAYEFHDPKRWDVVVFRFPNEAWKNYIKRLVGLPGESIQIEHGDIWVRSPKDTKYHIERKPPNKLLAMLRPVFDNDYMPAIAKSGWPEQRWKAEPAAGAAGAWRSEDPTTFAIDGQSHDEQWLRYRHLIPSYKQWQEAEEDRVPALNEQLAPQLIRDFTAYDTNQKRREPPMNKTRGLHWVGDLALQCTVDVQSDAGELIFELRKGGDTRGVGRRFQCRIDVATGRAVPRSADRTGRRGAPPLRRPFAAAAGTT
jgi:signal peptidase I